MRDEAKREIILGILSGEVDESAPDVRAQLESSPELMVELEEMRALETLLDRDVLELKRDLEMPPGRSVLGLAWRPLMGVAAALLLALGLWHFVGDSAPGSKGLGQGVMLGGDALGIRDILPKGPGSSFARFEYSVTAPGIVPSELRSRLEIWAQGAAPQQEPLLTLRFTGTQCELTPKQQESLPASIRWRILVEDQNKKLLGAFEVRSASL